MPYCVIGYPACNQYHQKAIRRRSRAPQKNISVCEEHHQPAGVLPDQYSFHFPRKVFEQQEGAAMGSPISLLVANLCMEEFETKAINSAPQAPISGKDL